MEIESQNNQEVSREIHVSHANIRDDFSSTVRFVRKQIIDDEENELQWDADRFGPYALRLNPAETVRVLRISEPTDMVEELHRMRRDLRDGQAGDGWNVTAGIATQATE